MNKADLTWSHDSFFDCEKRRKLTDEEVLALMDASAATEEIFLSLDRHDVFPIRHGQFFEDWRIRVVTHGSERFVRLDPSSQRTRNIMMGRKIRWMKEHFDYDDRFIDNYVQAAFGMPRVWIADTVRMVHDFSQQITKLKLVVGDGKGLKENLRAIGISYPANAPVRDIHSAIRVVEKMKDVDIFT